MDYLNRNAKKMKILFMAFMILQPIFDIFYLYTDEVINIFKFSPSTIIRMAIMAILFVTSLLMYKCDKNKKVKYCIIFSIIYGAYIIFHHVNSLKFSIPYGNFDNYSTVNELFYMIRMIMPLLLIFITYSQKLTWKEVKKVIIITVLIFSVISVTTNLFKVALTSYNDGNKIIKANFLQWFIDGTYEKYGYAYIASKGIFHMANQVSGTLICLFPIVIYIFFEEKINFKNIITIILMILSMLMLGTRVASYGWLAVIVSMIIMYLFFGKFIKNYHFSWKKLSIIIVICFCFTIVLNFSPVSNRTYINDEAENVKETIDKDGGKNSLTIFLKKIKKLEKSAITDEDYKEIYNLKINFIKNHMDSYGFDRNFIVKLYPYTEDCDFWLEQFSVPFNKRANHRQLKNIITKRIIDLNDNKLDYVFGMSFTRLRNASIYMENDIYVHLYSIGIIGILLFIAPYLVIAIYALVKIIKNKSKFTYLNMVYLMSIGLIFISGILSGNIFDEWIATLFLAFICGTLLLNINTKKEK